MSRFVLLCVTMLVFAACGGGAATSNDRAATIPSPTATAQSVATADSTAVPSTTEVAMTPQSTATVLPTKVATPTPQPSKGLPTSDQLKTALLTLSDMPTGWTTSDQTGSDSSSSSMCGATPTPTSSDETTVSVDFQKSQLGPFLTEQIVVVLSGQMKTAFDQIKNSLSCMSWTEPDSEGTPTTYQLSPLSFPKMGDDTFAFRMSGGSGMFTFEADAVYIRVGDSAITIANVAVGSVDSDLTASIAEKAVDKLRAFNG